MYNLFHLIETMTKFASNKCKLLYWKIKYGKRFQVGKNMRFRRGLIINISKDGCLKIGDGCFFNNYCSINCHKKIIIGNNNLFGEGVKIYDHNHIFNSKSMNMRTSFKDNIINIGNDNWFGSNVVVLSKAVVGDKNVFGVNTVVNSIYKSSMLVRLLDGQRSEEIDYRGSSMDCSCESANIQLMRYTKKRKRGK